MANNIYELDFTGVQSTNLIPEGTHIVRITSAEFKKASTGSDQLQLTFENSDGAVRSAWYSLVPQALWKLKGVLEALNIPCEGKIKLNTASFKNKTCKIAVEQDPNDDTKFIVTRVYRTEAPQAAQQVAYNSEPVQPSFVAPTTPTAPAVQVSPVQQATQPVQQNLPPWMQNMNAQPQAAPQGNLPPWMTQNK